MAAGIFFFFLRTGVSKGLGVRGKPGAEQGIGVDAIGPGWDIFHWHPILQARIQALNRHLWVLQLRDEQGEGKEGEKAGKIL